MKQTNKLTRQLTNDKLPSALGSNLSLSSDPLNPQQQQQQPTAPAVQHVAGAERHRTGGHRQRQPAEEVVLPQRIQRGRPAPPLDQILGRGSFLAYGHLLHPLGLLRRRRASPPAFRSSHQEGTQQRNQNNQKPIGNESVAGS